MRRLQLSAVRDAIAAGSLAICLATCFSACSHEPDAYWLGTASPLQEGFGAQTQAGIELAVEQINANGGINGVPLKLLVRNDRASGIEASKIAHEFAGNRDIIAVIGHASSGAMLAASRIYHDGELPAIATTASSPDLTGISPWVFRLIGSDSVNGVTLATFASSLEQRLGRPARAAVLYENDAYGRGLAGAFKRGFSGELISIDPIGDSTPLEPYVAFYKARKPDIVFVASTEAAGLRFLHEARRQELSALFLGGDGWQGVVADSAAAEGVYVGTPFTAQSTDSVAQRFVSAYTVKYGRIPDANAALGYDATKLVAQAISASGATRTAVRTYLATLSTRTPYHGASGTIRFDAHNDPVGDNFRVTRVQRGLMLPEVVQ